MRPDYALQSSAGAALRLQTDTFALQAVNNMRKLRVQAQPRAMPDIARFAALTGITVPADPQGVAAQQAPVYWLAPNDWLLCNPAAAADDIRAAWTEACASIACAVADMSDACSIIEVSGSEAALRLAEGCALDLEAFVVSHYALTRLQHLPVIIHRLDKPARFHILVERSVARYLRDWLADAG